MPRHPVSVGSVTSTRRTKLAALAMAATVVATLSITGGRAFGQSGSASADSAAATAFPGPGRVTGSTGVHDPSVVKAPNGTYIVVGTGNNLVIKTSTDRIAWRNAGVVWPNGAPWTTASTFYAGMRPVGRLCSDLLCSDLQ